MLLEQEKATIIPLVSLLLHNWLQTDSDNRYVLEGLVDNEETASGRIISGSRHNEAACWLAMEEFRQNNPTTEAKAIRQEFTEYVMLEGAVPWQWRSCHLA